MSRLMIWDRTYNDLCNEIEILEIRKSELDLELKIIQRRLLAGGPRTKLVASYSGMPSGNSDDTPLNELWHMVQTIQSKIDDVADILILKREAKKRMEERMSKFDTLEYRVAYMRDVERKTLAAIAAELQYSYDWIARISSKLKRMKQTALIG